MKEDTIKPSVTESLPNEYWTSLAEAIKCVSNMSPATLGWKQDQLKILTDCYERPFKDN